MSLFEHIKRMYEQELYSNVVQLVSGFLIFIKILMGGEPEHTYHLQTYLLTTLCVTPAPPIPTKVPIMTIFFHFF